eukprot:12943383-Alexandrium_andersonii.AAC.1
MAAKHWRVLVCEHWPAQRLRGNVAAYVHLHAGRMWLSHHHNHQLARHVWPTVAGAERAAPAT